MDSTKRKMWFSKMFITITKYFVIIIILDDKKN